MRKISSDVNAGKCIDQAFRSSSGTYRDDARTRSRWGERLAAVVRHFQTDLADAPFHGIDAYSRPSSAAGSLISDSRLSRLITIRASSARRSNVESKADN